MTFGENILKYRDEFFDDLGKLASVNVKGERTVGDADLVSRAEDYRALIPKFLDFSY